MNACLRVLTLRMLGMSSMATKRRTPAPMPRTSPIEYSTCRVSPPLAIVRGRMMITPRMEDSPEAKLKSRALDAGRPAWTRTRKSDISCGASWMMTEMTTVQPMSTPQRRKAMAMMTPSKKLWNKSPSRMCHISAWSAGVLGPDVPFTQSAFRCSNPASSSQSASTSVGFARTPCRTTTSRRARTMSSFAVIGSWASASASSSSSMFCSAVFDAGFGSSSSSSSSELSPSASSVSLLFWSRSGWGSGDTVEV
mmetsp:Transcript_38801/g.91650  ORF Transcript_38801/g.91650 Transcript_38801/m.91650 type:complete len:252 (+) Transcript_38801:198-953(+)